MGIPVTEKDKIEVFVSSEGTQYLWNRSQERVIQLTELELALLKVKVSGMSDVSIQNTKSGNGIVMGIPIQFNRDRLDDIQQKLKAILKEGPFIDIEDHVLDRLTWDSLLPPDHPDKRGWEDEEDVKNCVLTARRVQGVRLNVNHRHPDNTQKVMHLHPNLAIVIQGEKGNGQGRLVLVILNEHFLSVITIL